MLIHWRSDVYFQSVKLFLFLREIFLFKPFSDLFLLNFDNTLLSFLFDQICDKRISVIFLLSAGSILQLLNHRETWNNLDHVTDEVG